MKKLLEKSKAVFVIILKYRWRILLIVLLVSGFYWFQLRQSIAKRSCYDQAKEQATDKARREDFINGRNVEGGFMNEDYDTYYRWCLQSKGI